MTKAFRELGFFAYSKNEYPSVNKVLKARNLWNLIKVRALDRERTMFILEPDIGIHLAECRNLCTKAGILDEKCYVRCKIDKHQEMIAKIVQQLMEEIK